MSPMPVFSVKFGVCVGNEPIPIDGVIAAFLANLVMSGVSDW